MPSVPSPSVEKPGSASLAASAPTRRRGLSAAGGLTTSNSAPVICSKNSANSVAACCSGSLASSAITITAFATPFSAINAESSLTVCEHPTISNSIEINNVIMACRNLIV